MPLYNQHLNILSLSFLRFLQLRFYILIHRCRYPIVFIAIILTSSVRYQYQELSFRSKSASAGLSGLLTYSEEELQFLDQSITKILADSGFNGNILISRYGNLIYERSFGFASFNPNVPNNAQTTFQLASISKTFTSASVMLLQQDSLLHIDSLVQKYISEFPYNNITIRHLLHHTSGLQNYMWLVERNWRKPGKPTNEDVLQLFIDYKRPLNFKPGERFEYSNSGFVMLGLLVERVSGMPFSQFAQDRIFNPLGMNRTFVNDLHNPVDMGERAYGYRRSRGAHFIIPDDNLDGPLGDKGVFSTTHDMLRWDQSIYRHELLPSQLWKEIFHYGRLNNDSIIEYGLGWRLQRYLDKEIVHHPGRWHGFRTSFKRFPHDYTTIILLSNNNRGVLGIIEGIQNILYYDDREIWLVKNFPDSIIFEEPVFDAEIEDPEQP